jgi:hypothetical protein
MGEKMWYQEPETRERVEVEDMKPTNNTSSEELEQQEMQTNFVEAVAAVIDPAKASDAVSEAASKMAQDTGAVVQHLSNATGNLLGIFNETTSTLFVVDDPIFGGAGKWASLSEVDCKKRAAENRAANRVGAPGALHGARTSEVNMEKYATVLATQKCTLVALRTRRRLARTDSRDDLDSLDSQQLNTKQNSADLKNLSRVRALSHSQGMLHYAKVSGRTTLSRSFSPPRDMLDSQPIVKQTEKKLAVMNFEVGGPAHAPPLPFSDVKIKDKRVPRLRSLAKDERTKDEHLGTTTAENLNIRAGIPGNRGSTGKQIFAESPSKHIFAANERNKSESRKCVSGFMPTLKAKAATRSQEISSDLHVSFKGATSKSSEPLWGVSASEYNGTLTSEVKGFLTTSTGKIETVSVIPFRNGKEIPKRSGVNGINDTDNVSRGASTASDILTVDQVEKAWSSVFVGYSGKDGHVS